MLLIAYFLSALGASLVLTPICRHVSVRVGFVAKPKEDRWHSRPTALFGGVAIAASLLAIAATIPLDGRLWQLWGCTAVMAIFGFADDALSLKPSTKLIVQITVASALLFFGYRLHWLNSMVGDAMLTMFWLVGITNAFNLLDNMDGLCAGTAMIAGGVLLLNAVPTGGDAPTVLYLATFLGATAGFLVYNLHPASIFMGDTGSLFLGLNLAALTLTSGVEVETNVSSGLLSVVAVPVLPLLLPIFDTTLVTAVRLLSGRSPSQGGRDHTSHRLVAVGLSEPRAVATLWFLAAAGGTISLLVHRQDPGWTTVAAVTFLLAMIIFGVYLARIRVYDAAELAGLTTTAITPVVANFMYKRRVAEVLLDVCLVPLAYYIAYLLRFEHDALATNYRFFIQSMPVILGAQLVALFLVGGYRGTWRYFGLMDTVVFAKGVLIGTVAAQLIILYVYRFESYSRAVFVIYAAILMLLLLGSRASFRLVGEFILRRTAVGQRCLIYGTTGASLATIREAFGPAVVAKVLGFIDDNPWTHQSRVAGYPVLGDFETLLAMIERNETDCVVLNTTLLDAERLQRIEAVCLDRGVDLLRLQVHLNRVSAVS